MRVLILGGTTEARELKDALGDDAILALKPAPRPSAAPTACAATSKRNTRSRTSSTPPIRSPRGSAPTRSRRRAADPPRAPAVPAPARRRLHLRRHASPRAIPADARVFLTTGHHELEALADHPASSSIRALNSAARAPGPPRAAARQGPVHPAGRARPDRTRQLTHLVTKDSGGPDAKIQAARITGLPVILLRRPEIAGPAVRSPEEALELLRRAPSRRLPARARP